MAELLKIRPEGELPTLNDARRNDQLANGVVEVETSAPESIFSGLPEETVARLAAVLNDLLDVFRSREPDKEWCWHLALTFGGGRGQEMKVPPIPPNQKSEKNQSTPVPTEKKSP